MLTSRLISEIIQGHPLWKMSLIVRARDQASDDVLVETDDPNMPWVCVHLTWSDKQSNPTLPGINQFKTLHAWRNAVLNQIQTNDRE
jgi:hypothetical protein